MGTVPSSQPPRLVSSRLSPPPLLLPPHTPTHLPRPHAPPTRPRPSPFVCALFSFPDVFRSSPHRTARATTSPASCSSTAPSMTHPMTRPYPARHHAARRHGRLRIVQCRHYVWLAHTPAHQRRSRVGTSLSGSISTILTIWSWICAGVYMCGALPSPVCA